MSSIQNDPVYSLPFLYINSMVVSNDATTPNSVINISAGQCRDSNDVMDITLGTANPNLQGVTVAAPLLVSSASTGVNALDTGTVAASTLYYVFVIADSRYYQPTAGLLSLSKTAPVLPFGYDSFRVVGHAITDSSSHFLKGYSAGSKNTRTFVYDAPQATAITAGAATSYTAVNLSALVPSVDNLPVSIAIAFTPGAAGRQVFLQPVNATGDAVIVTGQVTSVLFTTNAQVLSQLATTTPEINYKVTNAGDAVSLKVAGFTYYV